MLSTLNLYILMMQRVIFLLSNIMQQKFISGIACIGNIGSFDARPEDNDYCKCDHYMDSEYGAFPPRTTSSIEECHGGLDINLSLSLSVEKEKLAGKPGGIVFGLDHTQPKHHVLGSGVAGTGGT